MAIRHEFWRLIASGLLDTYIDNLVAVTSRDARYRLWQNGAFSSALLITAYESLGYVPNAESVLEMHEYIADPVYNPREYTERFPPRPTNAAGGSGLSCDDPGTDYETVVFSWDFAMFAEVGPLSENASPGAGFYVLANRRVADGITGLPSLFLEVA